MVKNFNLYWYIKIEWGHWPPLNMCWIRPGPRVRVVIKLPVLSNLTVLCCVFCHEGFYCVFYFYWGPVWNIDLPSSRLSGRSEKPVLNPKRRGHRIGKIQEHVICRNWMICSIDYYGMEFYNKVVWMPRMNFVGKYFSKERKEER